MSNPSASDLRKKRGVVRRSITNLGKHLTELGELSDRAEANCHAQRLSSRLTTLDSKFRSLQYQLMSMIEEEDTSTIETEQSSLDKHDTDVDTLSVRIQQLLVATNPNSSVFPDKRVSLSRNLTFLEESLRSIDVAVNSLSPETEDLALVQQYQEELTDLKSELSTCRESLSLLELTEEDELRVKYTQLKTLHFNCCHKIKGILNSNVLSSSTSHTSGDTKGLKILKLEAPTFDGDILNWTRFWEQFTISIHEHSSLSDAEKFAYLQHSLKEGSAKGVIEGLAGTGEHYSKAIECLKARYDRPRLIHQSHVKMILETPSLKDGSGKELRRLHDVLQQHLRALDAAESEPLSQFVTSIIQLKLDSSTLFEWQKHTQSTTEVPTFERILEFIDLRARASEITTPTIRRTPKVENPTRKAIASFVANSGPSSGHCVVCKSEKHPLYHCSRFKEMSHHRKLSVVRNHNLCMNCLKNGHFLKNCKSCHHCRTCQKPHHTLLHTDAQEPLPAIVSSNTATGIVPGTLLMTCQVFIKAPDGSNVKVRALLDSASSSSFVSERLV